MGENRIYPRSHRIQTQTKHMKKIVLYQLNILDILQVEKFNHVLRSVRTNLNNILPHMYRRHRYVVVLCPLCMRDVCM